MSTAVLVPIKDFRQAKQRLAAVLTPADRQRLAKAMAARVLAAASPYGAWVVCDDADVAVFAESHNARVLWCPGLGLNGAIRAGVDRLASETPRVVVAHGDLPLATDFAPVATAANDAAEHGVALVPDRHGRGTNVLSVPTGVPFTFRFGANSFASHRAEAHRRHLPLRVVDDARLSWDLDVPDDLVHPDLEEFLSWLPMSLVNPPTPTLRTSGR
jgi:2-phospho-L-lactate guanylyltransferase